MGKNVRLSVVLPSYLEEENLRILLPRLHGVMERLVDHYEIIVVDTMSPLDHTKEVCRINNAKYINREIGNSFGDAVRTGIKEANSEYILFMDADGSHPPEFIPSLYQCIDDYDIVIASRYISGGYTENNGFLIFLSRVLNLTYSLVLNYKCKDISNNFKIYRAQLLKEIDLSCDHFDILEEILIKISKRHKHIRVKEVPFSFKKRMFGKTKRNLILFIFTYLYTLLRLLKLRFSE
jgi:dolichol-phosphate mannosyltransferase